MERVPALLPPLLFLEMSFRGPPFGSSPAAADKSVKPKGDVRACGFEVFFFGVLGVRACCTVPTFSNIEDR